MGESTNATAAPAGGDRDLPNLFAAAMDRLGPFESFPALAVAVSGGADSMALAILARAWARGHAGSVLALVVDHGLRDASANEAQITMARLDRLQIPASLLVLTTLRPGPALAERARIGRYQVLADACRDAGLLHLLLGHHASDQAETLAMRVLRGSGTHGLAGIAALRETLTLRLLRPVLSMQPERLRRLLVAHGVTWVEDPSNHDLHALRPRLRHRFPADADQAGVGQATVAVGLLRAREETQIAAELAVRATIRPEGFAVLSPGPISAAALGSLVRTIGGASYPSNPSRLIELARQPGPATIGGVRLVNGRNGIMIVREEAAIAYPVEARRGAVWDNRFRMIACAGLPVGSTIGKLGDDAAQVRRISALPSVVLRTLPAIRTGGKLAAVPNIGYMNEKVAASVTLVFSPPNPAAGPGFVPAALA